MKKELEKDVQKTIIEYLKLKKHFFMKVNTVGVYKKATGFYIPSQSVGAPDILVFTDGGYTVCLEIKTKTGKLSEHQELWKKRAEDVGMEYYIIKNLDELQEIGL